MINLAALCGDTTIIVRDTLWCAAHFFVPVLGMRGRMPIDFAF